MKGDIEWISVLFALFIFMGTIVFIVLMIRGDILSFTGGVKSDIDKIRAIEAAHMVEYCLTNIDGGDSNYILSSTLDKYDGNSIKDICGIENPTIETEIYDIEAPKSWVFKGAVKNPDHTIWISIIYDNLPGEKVVMGKLHVKV